NQLSSEESTVMNICLSLLQILQNVTDLPRAAGGPTAPLQHSIIEYSSGYHTFSVRKFVWINHSVTTHAIIESSVVSAMDEIEFDAVSVMGEPLAVSRGWRHRI